MAYKNRKDRLALLTDLLSGRATPKQLDTLRQSREVIHLTLNLGDGDEPQEPHYPQYHMEFDRDCNLIRRYDLYEDGRIELRND